MSLQSERNWLASLQMHLYVRRISPRSPCSVPEVSFANPSSIRFAAATWPSRCVCLIIPLLQHQNMPGMPMTLRSYPGNNPTYRLRNMSKLFCYQRLKQLFLSPANFKRCVLDVESTWKRLEKVDTEQYQEFPWWNGARHKHGHVCGRLNAETDGMAWGVWNYLMWLKSCLCQRLTLVSVSYSFLSFIVQQHCITTAGQVSVKTREDPWAVSLIFSCP